MCEANIEDMQHFILHCPAYNTVRIATVALQQPYEEDNNKTIGEFLFASNETELEKNKEVLYKLWVTREKKRKEKENQ